MKGYVYAIGTNWGEPVKIGVAASIAKRLITLQGGNPRTLRVLWSAGPFKHPMTAERMLHAALADARLRGEWFVTDQASIVASMQAFEDEPQTRLQREQISEESAAVHKAICVLVDRKSRRDGISLQAAIDALSAQHGFDRGSVWSMRYRPGPDIAMSKYARTCRAVWAEAGHELNGDYPCGDQLTAAVDVVASLPIEWAGKVEDSVFDLTPMTPPARLSEIDDLLARLEADRLPHQPDEKASERDQ